MIDDQPPLNAALEDYLAMATTVEDEDQLLRVWLFIGTERLARCSGRSATIDALSGLITLTRTVNPTTPWKD